MQIDARFLRSLLPRCGYNRNMSRAIRYAPFSAGGAGFRPLYIIQGTLMLKQIFKHINSPSSDIGKMLLVTISWTQAFLGTSQCFLTDVQSPIPPANPSWLLEMRSFLKEINGSIRIASRSITPQMLRQNDRCIMDIVLHQQRWKKHQIVQINSCRRYIQAQTLSDITNIQGTRILADAFRGDTILTESVRVSLFNQKRPGHAAWRTWNKFLLTISNRHGVLYNTLGSWIVSVDKTRHWPKTVYDPIQDILFTNHHGAQYRTHTRTANGIFSIQPTDRLCMAFGYPTATVITMGTLRPTHNYVAEVSFAPLQDLDLGIIPNIQVHNWDYNLLRYCRNLSEKSEILKHFRDGNIISCSDGSAITTGGSFGLVISTKSGQRLIKGRGLAPGAYPNSFRSEAYGVLATTRYLHHILCQCKPDKRYTIIHYIDNQSVIRRIKTTQSPTGHFPNHRLLSEQDVIDEIVSTISHLPIKFELEWIKGHQDAHTPYHQLPLAAQLNCDADAEAAAYIASEADMPLIVPPLPSTPGQLVIDQRSITSHIKRRVHEAAALPPLREYLEKTFQWDHNVYNGIDWENYHNIIAKYKNHWSTIVKHLHGISPTGSTETTATSPMNARRATHLTKTIPT